MKAYKIAPNDILKLIPSMGGGICTDKITVDGLPIMYMYRDEPVNTKDSGWRFFSGTEDSDYMANAGFHSVYDLNTIANYEPAIIPFLNHPVGSEFERSDDKGKFIKIA